MHDPGGKVLIRLPDDVEGSAVFGGKKHEYRYRLMRRWAVGPRLMVVMMNPSTAAPRVDDPSCAKCRRLAVKWGYGSLYIGNTFAYRATDQGQLAAVADPVGSDNDAHLTAMANDADLVVFAYGKPKYSRLRERGPAVVRMLADAGVIPHVLRLSKEGVPWHPLYLPEALTPVRWDFAPAPD